MKGKHNESLYDSSTNPKTIELFPMNNFRTLEIYCLVHAISMKCPDEKQTLWRKPGNQNGFSNDILIHDFEPTVIILVHNFNLIQYDNCTILKKPSGKPDWFSSILKEKLR